MRSTNTPKSLARLCLEHFWMCLQCFGGKIWNFYLKEYLRYVSIDFDSCYLFWKLNINKKYTWKINKIHLKTLNNQLLVGSPSCCALIFQKLLGCCVRVCVHAFWVFRPLYLIAYLVWKTSVLWSFWLDHPLLVSKIGMDGLSKSPKEHSSYF